MACTKPTKPDASNHMEQAPPAAGANVRIEDGRPEPKVAWASLPRDEFEIVLWTEEMAQAWVVSHLFHEKGCKHLAQMVFQQAYRKAVAHNRAHNIPVRWSVSLGFDVDRREMVLQAAVHQGRMSVERALQLLPAERYALFLERVKGIDQVEQSAAKSIGNGTLKTLLAQLRGDADDSD